MWILVFRGNAADPIAIIPEVPVMCSQLSAKNSMDVPRLCIHTFFISQILSSADHEIIFLYFL